MALSLASKCRNHRSFFTGHSGRSVTVAFGGFEGAAAVPVSDAAGQHAGGLEAVFPPFAATIRTRRLPGFAETVLAHGSRVCCSAALFSSFPQATPTGKEAAVHQKTTQKTGSQVIG